MILKVTIPSITMEAHFGKSKLPTLVNPFSLEGKTQATARKALRALSELKAAECAYTSGRARAIGQEIHLNINAYGALKHLKDAPGDIREINEADNALRQFIVLYEQNRGQRETAPPRTRRALDTLDKAQRRLQTTVQRLTAYRPVPDYFLNTVTK